MTYKTAAALVVALTLGGVFAALDPAGTIHGDAALYAAKAAAVALVVVLAQVGAGGAVLRARAPVVLDAPGGWLFAFGVGAGIHAAGAFVLASIGAAGPVGSAGLVGALACGWVARPSVRKPSLPSAAALFAGALLLAPALLAALAPANDTDEMYQHLALARLISDTGAFVGGWDHPDGSRPMTVHLIFATLYGLGGEAATRLWHLLLSVALVLGVREFAEARFGEGRGTVGALTLLGSYSFLHEAGLAYNDLPCALWLLLGMEAVLTGHAALLGVTAGLALSAKYTAAPVVLALGIAWLFQYRRFPWGSLWALVAVVPWWFRNTMAGLHPLFPYAGWPDMPDFVFVYTEKYGVGRSFWDWVCLPWNVLMAARLDSFAFLGRVSLGWTAVCVAVYVGWRRRDVQALGAVFILGFLGWAVGAQLIRYLLPLAGITAYLLGAAPRSPSLLWLSLLSLPQNLLPEWSAAVDRVRVVGGAETRDTYLERTLSAWPALRYLHEHVPNEPVAMLYAWHGYYIDQPWILGSVEDHVPSRYWLLTQGDASLTVLRDHGIRWLFVGDIAFIKKSYSFLPDKVYQTQFVEPTDRLRLLLERDATRVFEDGRWEVWRLDDAASEH